MTKSTVAIRKNKASSLYLNLKRIGCVLSSVGIVIYICTLVMTIAHTAQKKQLARTVRDEATMVAELEQKYYQSVGTVSLASAQAEGYSKPVNVRYGSLHPDRSLATAR